MFSRSDRRHSQDDAAASNASQHGEATLEPLYSEDCPSGRVYAYDLPPEFHKDLVLCDYTDLDQGEGMLRMWEGAILSDCFDDQQIAIQSTWSLH